MRETSYSHHGFGLISEKNAGARAAPRSGPPQALRPSSIVHLLQSKSPDICTFLGIKVQNPDARRAPPFQVVGHEHGLELVVKQIEFFLWPCSFRWDRVVPARRPMARHRGTSLLSRSSRRPSFAGSRVLQLTCPAHLGNIWPSSKLSTEVSPASGRRGNISPDLHCLVVIGGENSDAGLRDSLIVAGCVSGMVPQ